MDIDFLIGWWIKDIPYIFKKDNISNTWKNYNRIYVIASSNNKQFDKLISHIEKCESRKDNIKKYFQYTNSFNSASDDLRINGLPIDKGKSKNIKELYALLNLNLKVNVKLLDNLQDYSAKKYGTLKCGLVLNKPYEITDLVCMNLSSANLIEFIKGRQCTTLGFKISNNLIRVASSRIFTDPRRSLIEPITNSIDSYREMRGENSGVGKFGMGFFSLLNILDEPNNKIEIESIYSLSSGKCRWLCVITKSNDGYLFTLNSNISVDKRIKTGTTIKLHINSASKGIYSYYYSSFIYRLIEHTFYLVKDVSLVKGNGQKINNATSADKIMITVQKDKKGLIYTFSDNAAGMSLDILFSKLLVPSISTKSVEKFLKREFKSTNLTDIIITKKQKNELSNYCQLMISVGDIVIYEKEIPFAFFKYRDRTYEYNQIYILSLPALTPLPISRDDVIISDPIVYEAAKIELIKLLDLTIEKGNLMFLNRLLAIYSNYASDVYIYTLIDDGRKYIQSRKDVYFIPEGQSTFYNTIIRPYTKTHFQYVESDYVNYEFLTNHLLSILKYQTIDSINKKVIIVKGLSDIYTSGGLVDIIFVSEEFVNQNVGEWKDKIKLNYKMKLFPNGIPQKDIQFIDNLPKFTPILNNISLFEKALYNSFKPKVIYHYIYLDKSSEDITLITNYIKKFYDVVESFYTNNIRTDSHPGIYGSTYKESSSQVLYKFIFELLSVSYLATNRDKEFLDRIFSIFYTFLVDFANRSIEGEDRNVKFLLNNYSIFMDKQSYIMKGNHDHFLEVNFYNISTKEEKDNLINFVTFYCSNLINIRNQYVGITNPFSGIFLWRYLYRNLDDKNIINDDIGFYIANFLLSKDFAYWPYIQRVTQDILRKEDNFRSSLLKNYKSVLEYLYKEISTKYNVDSLRKMIVGCINKADTSEMTVIVNDLIFSTKIFLEISNLKLSSYELILPEYIDHNYKFDCITLINYVYEYNVGTSTTKWFTDIEKFVPKHSSKFQSLEIAINEGTSKTFVDAVLTEMIQNSIDASRKIDLQNDLFLKVKSGIFKIDGIENYGMSVKDYVGIPTAGIVSILIPFLSTKSGSESFSTGEMGTGFMNVYRQPYTKKVIIKTRNPDDGLTYVIIATPIVENKRTVNVLYEITVSTTIKHRKTEIVILFNDIDKNSISSVLSDVDIWCNRYLPYLYKKSKFNSKIMYNDKQLVYQNKYLTAYKIPDDQSSIILTNGIPYGNLYPYLSGDNHTWTKYFGSSGVIIDLNKSIYTPVQSRKRVVFSADQYFYFDDELKRLIFYKIISDFPKHNGASKYKQLSDMGFIEGSNYNGPFTQCKPSDNYVDLLGTILFDFKKTPINVKSLIKIIINELEQNHNKYVAYGSVNISKKILTPIFDLIKNNPLKYFGIKDKDEIANFNEYLFVPNIYTLVEMWFSNKTFPSDEQVKGISQEISIPNEIKIFIQSIINRLWDIAKTLIKDQLLYGSKSIAGIPYNNSPIFKSNIIKGFLGFYNSNDHTININMSKFNLDAIAKDIITFKKLKNKNDIILFLKNGNNFDGFFDMTANPPKLFVHEMCHAMQGESHGPNAHGDFSYKIRTSPDLQYVEKNFSFYTGAREIFLYLITYY